MLKNGFPAVKGADKIRKAKRERHNMLQHRLLAVILAIIFELCMTSSTSNRTSCSNDYENDVDSDNICALTRPCRDNKDFRGPFGGNCASYADNGKHDGFCVEDGACEKCQCSCSDECPSVYDICPFDALNDADSDNICALTKPCRDNKDFRGPFGGNCASFGDNGRNNGFCVEDGACEKCQCSCSDECPLVYDICPFDALNDADSDKLCAGADSCPDHPNNDVDRDGICHNIDFCPYDSLNDADSDFICGNIDTCPSDAQNDEDSDRLCASQDSCPLDSNNDVDGDDVCFPEDICPQDSDNDRDSDNLCLNDDSCPNDPDNDVDSDRICGNQYCVDKPGDKCESYRRGSGRFRGFCRADGKCDVCECACGVECGNEDVCPLDAENDVDRDGVCADVQVDISCSSDFENDADSDNICALTRPCRDKEDFRGPFGGNCASFGDGGRHNGFCVEDGACEKCQCSCSDECPSVYDVCPFDPQNDADSDNVCADADSCPLDSENDADGDNVCADVQGQSTSTSTTASTVTPTTTTPATTATSKMTASTNTSPIASTTSGKPSTTA